MTLGFWILDPLYNALGGLLAAFYRVAPDFALAIVLLTASVSLLRMPLVAKQVKSQQAMQRIQPEIKRIQAKYKSDPTKRNEALMAAYKEHNVNPLASCLPLLLQMPLFIVLYRLIIDLSAEPPKHLPQPSRLHSALVESGGDMQALGMNLAERASDMSGGALVPVGILIALVVATGFYQTRQMQARMPKDAINPQMAIIGKVFPIMFGVISFTIPAGVVLYFLVSNIWQIGQQAFMFRHGPPGGPASPTKSADTEVAPPKKGGGRSGSGPKGTSGRPDGKGPGGTDGTARGRGDGTARDRGDGKNGSSRPRSGGSGESGGARGSRRSGRPNGSGGSGGSSGSGGSGTRRPSGRVTPPSGRSRPGGSRRSGGPGGPSPSKRPRDDGEGGR